MPRFDRRSFLRALGAFFAVTVRTVPPPFMLWPTSPSACTPPNTPCSLDGYMLTIHVAQNLYLPLGHAAASLS